MIKQVIWNQESESAFNQYKNELTNATMLAHPSSNAT